MGFASCNDSILNCGTHSMLRVSCDDDRIAGKMLRAAAAALAFASRSPGSGRRLRYWATGTFGLRLCSAALLLVFIAYCKEASTTNLSFPVFPKLDELGFATDLNDLLSPFKSVVSFCLLTR